MFSYHLHPVKVKRHGVRLSYTLCLGGLSFFLFIVLTITGIWLMFYFRPTGELAYVDIQALQTSVAFGSLVRNMHRWGAHLMVLVVFLHMSRVFYHGAYKAPREFNWVIGVILFSNLILIIYRLFITLGPISYLGCDSRWEYGGLHTCIWSPAQIYFICRIRSNGCNTFEILCFTCIIFPIHNCDIHGNSFLES